MVPVKSAKIDGSWRDNGVVSDNNPSCNDCEAKGSQQRFWSAVSYAFIMKTERCNWYETMRVYGVKRILNFILFWAVVLVCQKEWYFFLLMCSSKNVNILILNKTRKKHWMCVEATVFWSECTWGRTANSYQKGPKWKFLCDSVFTNTN